MFSALLKKYFFIFFITFTVHSQLLPPIQSYSPDQYGAANQNWAITQSIDNDLFFANSYGLLKFNGSRWSLFPSPNGVIVRSIKSVENRIYAGLYENFGYWEENKQGSYEFVSLVKSNDLVIENDEEFWNILQYDNWIIFQSLSRLIMYNESSGVFKFLNPEEDIFNSFIVDKRLYFTLSSGLYTLEDGQEVLLSNDSRLRNRSQSPHIVNIFKEKRNLLILTDEMEFFELNPSGKLTSWNSIYKNSEDLSSINVYDAKRLENGHFALATVGKGLILLDSNGIFLNNINKSKGISNNTVLSVFEDFKNNLWLGLDNGISLINSKSPFKIFNDNDGVLGTVYASKLHKNYLYVGTNQGLFFKKYKTNDPFKQIPRTIGQVWNLTIIDGELFCGHNEGSFLINNGTATKIPQTAGTWGFKKPTNSSDLILEGNYSGFNVLYKNKGVWKVRNKINGFDISSRFFEITSNGDILVSHGYKGIYKLSLSSDLFSLKSVKIDSSVSIGGSASLSKFDNEIYYNYSEGFYKYNEQKDAFEKDVFLSNLSAKELINGIIINDENKKLWMFTENHMHYLSKDLMSNEKKISTILFPEKLRKTVYENISKIEDDNYIIGTNNGFISFNLDNYSVNPPQIQIDRIEVSKVNDNSRSIVNENDFQLDYKTNNITFYYNTTNFQKFKEVQYQYILDGYLNEWSEWNGKSEITFSNLRFGNYEFKVRSKIGNDISGEIKTVEFSIERPWYGSNFMIANYALILGVLFFITNTYYNNFYKRKEEKMIRINANQLELKEIEKKQALMVIENEKLSQDIDGKNRELAISTMSMIKKNQFLSKIKKDLKQVDSTQKASSVINIIDRHLNNQDDWKFFEEAFNNADKDFLKKVKNYHPSLTNNDLRLCAYLRLNLSSKDIAPLLNISLSSVEIKRYRLRKKMNLSRNEGLTDHLLSL